MASRLILGSSDGPFGTAHDSEHAVVLETEVVVQVAGKVLLHAEEPLWRARASRLPGRFGGLAEVAFLAILLEGHLKLQISECRLQVELPIEQFRLQT